MGTRSAPIESGARRIRLRVLLAALVLAGASACAQLAGDPSAIVRTAVDAAREQDREAFLACFTPRSRPLLITWWNAVDDVRPALGRLGASEVAVTDIKLLRDRDVDVERAIVSLREGQASMRVIVHRLAGEWRIDLRDTERAQIGNASL